MYCKRTGRFQDFATHELRGTLLHDDTSAMAATPWL
jgi:hypothetical protein